MSGKWICLALGLVVLAARAQTSTEGGAVCAPGRPLGAPDYPVAMARKGAGGEVVLDLTVDACGRVLDAVVTRGDQPAFNAAALASVRGVTLSEAQRAATHDGHVSLPIRFGFEGGLSYQKVDWPRTHRRPRYLPDDQPMDYASAEAADAGIQAPPGLVWPSPYPIRSRFVQLGPPEQREFWLFVSKGNVVNLAARYRPVLEAGEDVVRLAILCEDDPAACRKAEAFLLKGLPFAKASH